MFEDKTWSEALKEVAKRFWNRLHEQPLMYVNQEALEALIEVAIKEGQQEVLDDPRSFNLYGEDDVNERAREREPQRDESRD